VRRGKLRSAPRVTHHGAAGRSVSGRRFLLAAATSNVTVRVLDPTGVVAMLRVNHTQPPFNNPAIRRALWGAVDQTAFMQSLVGTDDLSLYHVPLGFFCPNTPMDSEAGLDPLRGPRNLPAVRQALKDAGYQGETVLLMVPSNSQAVLQLGTVAADMLKQAGMNVEVYTVEFNAMLQRRNRRGPVSEGGWCQAARNEGLRHLPCCSATRTVRALRGAIRRWRGHTLPA